MLQPIAGTILQNQDMQSTFRTGNFKPKSMKFKAVLTHRMLPIRVSFSFIEVNFSQAYTA
jgi:hypothetical protein